MAQPCFGVCEAPRFTGSVCPRSSTGRPDWTCIVVGFTSGYVRFYTEVRACGLPKAPELTNLRGSVSAA